MTEDIAPTGGGEPSPRKPASGGRWLAGAALLFGLAGTVGAAYLYYTLVFLDPAARTSGRIEGLDAGQRQLRARQDRLSADLLSFQREQRAALEGLGTRLEESEPREMFSQWLEAAKAPEPPSEQAWELAEVEYLLRIANHRLLMERDVGTALGLLNAADEILAGHDDIAMHDVRAMLASEILSLEQTPSADIPGIYLRLDAVKRQLSALTLAPPVYSLRESMDTADAEAAVVPDGDSGIPGEESESFARTGALPDAPLAASEPVVGKSTESSREGAGFLDSLASELGKFVRLRRIGTGFKPPLAPSESAYQELNLRLMLEQAQLAALRHDQAVYASSLDAALEWIATYLDGQGPAVKETTQTLAALRGLNVESALPDISGSLNALRKARQANP